MKKFKVKIFRTIIRFFLLMDNYAYKTVSKYATKLENGIHPKHRLTKYHNFFLNNINEKDEVLDVGCGNGFNTYCIAEKAARVTGIDINTENIKYAKSSFMRDNIEYINADVLNYSFNQKYDVIILSNVLEHLNSRVDFLIKLKDITDKFLIRVPMLDRGWMDLYKKELGIEYRLDKGHYIEYTFDEFNRELTEAGLKISSHTIQFGEIWAVVEGA